jgi:serine/threonine protein kinase
LDGLQYLNKERIIHCDIDEENIMFSQTSHNGIRLKYVDFGLSKQLDDERAAKQDIKELGSVSTI